MEEKVTREDLTYFENLRLNNIANMYVNIAEDEGEANAISYLSAQLRLLTFEDVKPFIAKVYKERGYEVEQA